MSSTAISRLIHPFVKDRFLHALLLAGVAMFAFHPQPMAALGGFIDGRTLITLLGLMLLTKGVEVSGYFDFVAARLSTGCIANGGWRCSRCSLPRCCRRF